MSDEKLRKRENELSMPMSERKRKKERKKEKKKERKKEREYLLKSME